MVSRNNAVVAKVRHDVSLPKPVADAVRVQAERRRLKPGPFVAYVMETIARDKLFDAVLDDREGRK